MQQRSRFRLKLGLEFGAGTFLWTASIEAQREFGYAVEFQDLPISTSLKHRARFIASWWDTFLDWEEAPLFSKWSTQEHAAFAAALVEVLDLLDASLGPEFTIEREPNLKQLLVEELSQVNDLS